MKTKALRETPQNRILCIGRDLDLRGGGAERVQLTLLQHIDRTKFDVRAVFTNDHGEMHRLLPGHITPHSLVRPHKTLRSDAVRALVRLVRYCRDVDMIFAMQDGTPVYFAVAASLLTGVPVVAWVHTIPSFALMRFDRWHRLAMPLLYRRVRSFICVSEGARNDLTRHFDVSMERTSVAPNPLDIETVRKLASEGVPTEMRSWFDKPTIIGLGRLVPLKRFDLLIEAVGGLLKRGMDVNLVIVGHGPERQRLERITTDLGITDRVFFAGFQANPYPFLKAASVVACSSDNEGFSMALVEAMAIGTAVVSTDCPCGPREILLGGECGILSVVGDPDALSVALEKALTSTDERRLLIQHAVCRAESFSAEGATRKLEHLLVAACSAPTQRALVE